MAPTQNNPIWYDSTIVDPTIPADYITNHIFAKGYRPEPYAEPKKKPPVKGSSGFAKFIKQKHENR